MSDIISIRKYSIFEVISVYIYVYRKIYYVIICKISVYIRIFFLFLLLNFQCARSLSAENGDMFFSADNSNIFEQYLGHNPPLSSIFAMNDGKIVNRKSDVVYAFLGHANEGVKLFAIAKTVDLSRSLSLNVSMWNGEKSATPPNQIFIFDDFINSDGTINDTTVKKYNLNIHSTGKLTSPCFVIRQIDFNEISKSILIFDLKISNDEMMSCVVRTAIYSFGLDATILEAKEKDKLNRNAKFLEEFGSFILRNRDKCSNISENIFYTECLVK